MRSILRRAVISTALATTALAWSGCDAKRQTQYVAGISTQVHVPRDLRAIRISVSVGGFNQFCQAYRVYDGVVRLPRSLGTFAQNDPRQSGPLTYSIVGYTDELDEGAEFDLDGCLDVQVGQRGARVLRRSRQPYIFEEIKFLPLPLKYSCYDHTGCDDSDKTCRGGRCVDAAIDADTLPRFTEDLVDGTGSTCFSVGECMGPAIPAAVVDTNDCTYALPGSESAPEVTPPFTAPPKPFGEGINVEVTYDGGLNKEILDKDPEEGFTIPDPDKPQRFRLAPGLCDMVKGVRPDGTSTPHRITTVRASGVCRAKSPFQPLCANDLLASMGAPEGNAASTPTACVARELKPAKSVLMIVADNTLNSEIFFNGADRAAFEISLSDPSFARTEIGLTFMPGSGACTPTPAPFARTLEPVVATQARAQIAAAFKARADEIENPVKAPEDVLGRAVDMDGALRDTYQLLRSDQYADYHQRAVLVIGNRDFGTSTCGAGTPAEQATAARADRIATYVVMLARQPSENPELPVGTAPGVPFLPEADALAVAGSLTSPPLVAAYDARRPADKARGQDAFRRVVEDLATCAYDVENPSDAPAAGDFVSFSNPVPLPPTPDQPTYVISHAPACNSASAAADGWGMDASNPRRVRLCGQACTTYRDVLKKAAFYANQYGQPALPVPVFAFKNECQPK